MTAPVFLAGVYRYNLIRSLIPTGSSVTQAVIYFGALFLVVVGVFAWAVIFRPQRRRRHSHHHPKPAQKQHRQPGARPRSRTLAETGGLPPVRTEEQPPPPA